MANNSFQASVSPSKLLGGFYARATKIFFKRFDIPLGNLVKIDELNEKVIKKLYRVVMEIDDIMFQGFFPFAQPDYETLDKYLGQRRVIIFARELVLVLT